MPSQYDNVPHAPSHTPPRGETQLLPYVDFARCHVLKIYASTFRHHVPLGVKQPEDTCRVFIGPRSISVIYDRSSAEATWLHLLRLRGVRESFAICLSLSGPCATYRNAPHCLSDQMKKIHLCCLTQYFSIGFLSI